jgi:hypothetical protein
MRGRFEIGLADAEIDDVAPLACNSAALASTANAFSFPIRSKAGLTTTDIGRGPPGKAILWAKAGRWGKGDG